jgi:hypothetical protein
MLKHGPKYEVVKFSNLNDDDSFVLPAFHFIEWIVTDKLSSSSFTLDFAPVGDDPYISPGVGGEAGTPLKVNSTSLKAWDTDKTIEVSAQGGWSGREIDLWVLMTSLGEG